MHPVWFYVFGYPVHIYAVMMAIGFVAGVWLSVRHAERIGLDRDMMLDLCWWLLVGGLVGSRIAFIFVNWDQYWYACVDFEYFNAHVVTEAAQRIKEADCTRILRFWTGGIVFYGGALGGILTMFWFMRREGLSVWPVADALIPQLALGQFFGRFGCFAAGCCWGHPTDHSFAVQFPGNSMASRQHAQDGLIDSRILESLAVHPIQLYDALGGLLLFAFLVWLRSRKRYHGQVFIWWLLLYPLMRSTMELFRGDTERGFAFGPVSTSQFISIAVAVFAIVLIFRLRRGLTDSPQSG